VTDISIRVEGADELRRALKSVGNTGLLAALAAANENAAEIVVDAAMPHVPRRSGALRTSVHARASAQSGRAVTDLPYAAAIHWGRKRGNVGRPPGNRKGNNPIAGRPFLWDAAQRKVPQIEPEYRDEIMQIIAEAIRRNGAAT
jgi:hypothetical protein